MNQIETPSLEFIINMVIYSMDIDQLLDNLTFELDTYVLNQYSFLEKGIFIKISFKKTIHNFDEYGILSNVFKKIFITINKNSIEQILLSSYRFNLKKKDFPFIVDENKEVSISILDEKDNQSFKELIIKEKPSVILEKGLNRSIKSYFNNPEILKIINQKKYFYLKLEGFDQISIQPDLDLTLSKIKERHIPYIKKNIEQIKDKIVFFNKKSNKNISIINKILKINEIVNHPKLFRNELLNITFLLEDLSFHLSKINRIEDKIQFENSIRNLNLKKISIKNYKKSLLFKELQPEEKQFDFIMKFKNDNIYLFNKRGSYVS